MKRNPHIHIENDELVIYIENVNKELSARQ